MQLSSRTALVIGRGPGAIETLRKVAKTRAKPVVYSANDAWLILPDDLKRRFPCDFTVSMDSNNHRETMKQVPKKYILMQPWLAENMPGVEQLVELKKSREGCTAVDLVRPLNSGMAAVCYAAQNHTKVIVAGVSGLIDGRDESYRDGQLELLKANCDASRIRW